IREMPEHKPAEDCADARERRNCRAKGRREVPLPLQKCRIHVLCSMGSEQHHRHEEEEIEEELPMGENLFRLFAHRAASTMGLSPYSGFSYAKVNKNHERKRRQAPQEEQRPPANAIVKTKKSDCGEDISSRIPLLQQAGKNPALPFWRAFHSER